MEYVCVSVYFLFLVYGRSIYTNYNSNHAKYVSTTKMVALGDLL